MPATPTVACSCHTTVGKKKCLGDASLRRYVCCLAVTLTIMLTVHAIEMFNEEVQYVLLTLNVHARARVTIVSLSVSVTSDFEDPIVFTLEMGTDMNYATN